MAHAWATAPEECCGLLIGSRTRIDEAVPATNVADDRSRRYVVPPAEYVAQIHRCRAEGARAVVGVYHSHPASAPVPSASDLAEAFSDFWFVIAGPVDGHAPLMVRGYHLVDGRLREEPLIVVASAV